MSAQQPDLLPPRSGESAEERRLRECINRNAGQMMTAIDASLRLRSASGRVQKTRNLARNQLEAFGLNALHAFTINQGEKDG